MTSWWAVAGFAVDVSATRLLAQFCRTRFLCPLCAGELESLSNFSNVLAGFADLRHFDRPLQPTINGFKFYQGENQPTKGREL